MQLDAHATNQDINTFIDFLCDSDDTSFSVQNKVLNINAFYEELAGEIILADGDWQFDDTNYTNLPVGKGTLVEGQQTYSFASEYLSIEAIEVLNLAGNTYRRLKPIDHNNLNGLSPDEYFGTDSSGNPNKGIPEYFDILGDTIFLYPAPAAASMTLANGIQVWFKRTVDLFTTADTTQEPAFPSAYHSILAYGASIPYCMKYKKDRVALYQKKVDQMTKGLLAFYGQRDKYTRKIMTNKGISHF